MTVTSATTRNDYVASSGQTVFPYTFTALADTDIKVLKNGVALSLGGNYSVTYGSYGGTVTLTSGATTGDAIAIYLDMPLQRTTNYQNSGDFLALDVNGDFDALWLALQQTTSGIDRTVRLSDSDPNIVGIELPLPDERAQKLLAFSPTGAVTVQPYVGGQTQILSRDSFTGDGSTTTFTMSESASDASMLNVIVNGLMQDVSSYSVTNNTSLVFSEAPPRGANIEVRSFVQAEVVSTELKTSEFAGNGSTTSFTLVSSAVKNNTFVYINGVYQFKSTYSVSGTTITFSTAPPLGSSIEVMVAGFTTSIIGSPAANSVGTSAIQDNAVTAAKIADGTITASKLGTGVGGAFNNFLVKTANYTAVTRDQLIVNSGSAVTITLPASPSAGNIVFIENAGAGTVTVARNGSKINSTADDGELATDAGATLVYVDSPIGWKEL